MSNGGGSMTDMLIMIMNSNETKFRGTIIKIL